MLSEEEIATMVQSGEAENKGKAEVPRILGGETNMDVRHETKESCNTGKQTDVGMVTVKHGSFH